MAFSSGRHARVIAARHVWRNAIRVQARSGRSGTRCWFASPGSALRLAGMPFTSGFPMLYEPGLGVEPCRAGLCTEAFVAAIGQQASGLNIIVKMNLQDILDNRLA